MDWLLPYRKYIMRHTEALRRHRFTMAQDDDFSIRFIHEDVSITFCVERYSQSLSVWVAFLGEVRPDNKPYRLDMVMRVDSDAITAESFKDQSEDDKAQLVERYVEFILRNQSRLFAKVFPLAAQYDALNQQVAAEALLHFAPIKP